MATGLLVLGVGRATRLLRYLGELPKTYAATGRLGEETDTLDADGELVRTAPVDVSLAEAERACAALVGRLDADPARVLGRQGRGSQALRGGPRGRRARGAGAADPGRCVRGDRRSTAADLEVLITCSGGTYVRVLVADVGRALGCGAHLVRPAPHRDRVAPGRRRPPARTTATPEPDRARRRAPAQHPSGAGRGSSGLARSPTRTRRDLRPLRGAGSGGCASSASTGTRDPWRGRR
mgnify:CR=1 FL=1